MKIIEAALGFWMLSPDYVNDVLGSPWSRTQGFRKGVIAERTVVLWSGQLPFKQSGNWLHQNRNPNPSTSGQIDLASPFSSAIREPLRRQALLWQCCNGP
jgi:hypothetical protein